MDYEVNVNKQPPTELIHNKNSYLQLLKYHILFVFIPLIVIIIVFFSKISTIVSLAYNLYYLISGEEKESTISVIIQVIRLLFMIFANGIVIAFFVHILKTGLHFIPYLSINNRLSIWRIFRISIKKFFQVLLLNWVVGFLMVVVLTVLMLLPIVNILSAILVPYCTALFVIYKEYMFTSNLLNGRGLLSSPLQHAKVLYGQHKEFLLYAAVLALSYYALMIAAVFVKPFIQVKIIELFQPPIHQNYERTTY